MSLLTSTLIYSSTTFHVQSVVNIGHLKNKWNGPWLNKLRSILLISLERKLTPTLLQGFRSFLVIYAGLGCLIKSWSSLYWDLLINNGNPLLKRVMLSVLFSVSHNIRDTAIHSIIETKNTLLWTEVDYMLFMGHMSWLLNATLSVLAAHKCLCGNLIAFIWSEMGVVSFHFLLASSNSLPASFMFSQMPLDLPAL